MSSPITYNDTTPIPPSTTTQISLTSTEFWIQLIIFYGILAGIISTIINVAMSIGILKSNKLRNRFFVIVFCLCVGRACLGTSYFSISIYRSLRTLNLVDTNIKRISCYLIHFHLYYSVTLEMVLLLGLVIDRILAIVAFKFYRKLTYKQAIFWCAVASSITVTIEITGSLWGMRFNEIIPCINIYSPTFASFNRYFSTLGLTLGVLIFLLYIGLIVYIRFRLLPKIKADLIRTGDQTGLIAFKRNAKLLALLQKVLFMHTGITIVGQILSAVTLSASPAISLRLVYFNGIVATIDLFSNSIVLLASHKDLRNAAFPYCFKSVSPVHTFPMAAVPNQNQQGPVRRNGQ